MAEPTEAEVTRDAIVSWLAEVHTSMPGKVLSYDPAKQVADVQPAVQRAVPRASGGWAHTDYPAIPNVRVAWLSAGGCSLQLPLSAGDAVWLLFSEVCWAQYRRSGQIAPPGDHRRFDLSYPVALPVQLVQALRSVTGPHFEVPDGQALTVGGDPGATQPVARGDLVAAQLSALKSAINGWLPTAMDGGAALKAALTSWLSSSSDVGATKLKTE